MSKRKKHRYAKDALQLSPEGCIDILKALPDIIYKIDPDEFFTFINDSVRRLGYKPEELIGEHFSKIVHPDDVKSFSKTVVLPKYKGKITGDEKTPKLFDERRTGKRKTKNLEIRLIQKNWKVRKENTKEIIGTVITFGDVSSTGHYDTDVHRKDKKFLGTLGIIRNITERKWAEESLKAFEGRYRNLVELAPVAILAINLKGIVTSCNKTFSDLTGFTRTEVLGRHFLKLPFLNSKDKAKYHRVFTSISRCKVPKHFEVTWIHKDGTTHFLEINAGITKEGNKISGIQIIGVDITERKRTEEKLNYQADMLKNVSDAIISTNLAFDILTWNKAAENMYGWKVNEVLGKPINQVTQIEFPCLQGNEVFKEFFKKGYWKGEVIQKCKDGTFINVIASVSLLKDNEENPVGVVAVSHDITERKRAEENLHQSLNKLRKLLEETVNALASAVGKRDPYTASHQQRVTKLACAIAEELKLPKTQIDGINIAGLLHDIGKIALPAEILSKPTRLIDAEFTIVKTHPVVGYDILKTIEFPWPIADIVLQHHEWLNGSGYPQGLKNEEILLEAKILGVADIVEAMSSHRPYRPARGLDVTLEQISKNKGVLYDPKVVDVCLKLFSEKGFKFE
ncbi:hypothetical protein ES705_24119 [subsurface metagenome]